MPAGIVAAFVLLLALVPPAMLRPADAAVDTAPLGRLADQLEQRLVLAEAVARTKWNGGQPIRDPAREQAVIESLTARAVAAGLDPAFAAAVIEAQIAASRQVQEELHAAWQAEGRGPFDQVPDLKSELRPRLDALNDELVQALAAAAPVLATPSGREAFLRLAGEAMAARSPAVRALALAPFAAA